jgi:hypothetical protein
VLADGALEVIWPPAADHPLTMTAIYHWRTADTLDMELVAKPDRDMPRFEVVMSAYFIKDFEGSFYLKPDLHLSSPSKQEWLAPEANPLIVGTYLMFPRDQAAIETIFDNRWA